MFFYVFPVFYTQIPVLKLQYNAWLNLCIIDWFSQTLICNEASFMSILINKLYKLNMNLMWYYQLFFYVSIHCLYRLIPIKHMLYDFMVNCWYRWKRSVYINKYRLEIVSIHTTVFTVLIYFTMLQLLYLHISSPVKT